MKTLIVPIDFSDTSINAASYAIDLAASIKAEVILLHVVTLPVIIEVPVSASSYEIKKYEAIEELEELKKALQHLSNNEVSLSARVTIGEFYDEVEEIVKSTNAFGVIMGVHLSGSAERILFGSSVYTLMNKLPIPIMIIPEHAECKKISKIALAINMKEVPETIALNYITSIINVFDSKLDILYVSKHSNTNTEEVSEYAKVYKGLAMFEPSFHHLISDDVGKEILKFMHQEKTDLLIVFPKKHNFIDGLFHKSISKEIAMHCDVPVMTING